MAKPAEEEARVLPSRRSTPRSSWAALLFAAMSASWLAASSGIILVNRYIIRDINFPYPITLSAYGLMVSFLASWMVCDVLKQAPPCNVDARLFMTRIVPIGVGQGIGIWLSNKLYLYLAVSFIEMARASLPLLTMTGLWLAKLENPTRGQVLAVTVAALGAAISAGAHQVVVSLLGLVLLAANFAIEVARLVMLQYLLQGLNLGAWQSVKLMALPAAVSLTAMAFIFEWSDMAANGAGTLIMQNLPAFIMAGSLGLAVNQIASAIIQLSTATTVKLLAAVRGPIIVLAAVVLFAEQVTAMQTAGYALAIAGFASYQWLHARAKAQAGTQPSSTSAGGQSTPSEDERQQVQIWTSETDYDCKKCDQALHDCSGSLQSQAVEGKHVAQSWTIKAVA